VRVGDRAHTTLGVPLFSRLQHPAGGSDNDEASLRIHSRSSVRPSPACYPRRTEGPWAPPGLIAAAALASDAPTAGHRRGSCSPGSSGCSGCAGRSPAIGPAFLPRPGTALLSADRQWPELIERETPVRERVVTYSIRVSFASRPGSMDCFQILVRWKLMPRQCRSWRSRSRPMATGRGAPAESKIGAWLGRRQHPGQRSGAGRAGAGQAAASWSRTFWPDRRSSSAMSWRLRRVAQRDASSTTSAKRRRCPGPGRG
jgi:hypothetical protein